jgi:cell wall-associated NlpC family hydrolase
MAIPRHLARLAGRFALPILLGGGLAIGTAMPAHAQQPDQIPDIGARPAPAGQVALPDGSAMPPSANPIDGPGAGPLAGQMAQVETRIAGLVDRLRQLEPQLPPAQAAAAAAHADWQTAEADRQGAEDTLHALVEEAFQGAAALPPQLYGDPLRRLAAHVPLPVEAPLGGEAVARTLKRAEDAAEQALRAYNAARDTEQALDREISTAQSELARQQSELERLRDRNADLLAEQEAAEQRRAAAGGFPLQTSVAGLRAHDLAQRAVAFALRQLGKPYLWGAEGPDRYDCSGLMWDAYRSVGITLPRVAADQYRGTQARPVARHALLPGDLVFFSRSRTDWRQIHHVGMYLGDGRIVHAPNRNDVVKVSPMWWSSFFGATRVVPAVPVGPPTLSPDPTLPTTPGPDPTVTVPDLSGLTADEAVEVIVREGLVPAPQPAVTGDCDLDEVAEQQPGAGTEVAEGSVVRFAICAQAMPDLERKTETEAREILTALDLGLEISTTRTSSSHPADEVLGTIPAVGAPLSRGDRVTLDLSLGDRIPNLTGMTCLEAEAALDALGLPGVFKAADQLSDEPTGLVVDQDPLPEAERPADLPDGSPPVVTVEIDSPDACDPPPADPEDSGDDPSSGDDPGSGDDPSSGDDPDSGVEGMLLLLGTIQIRNLLADPSREEALPV